MDVRAGLWRKLSTEELMLLNCGVREDLTLERRSKQSILKEINPEYSLEELMLKLQYFGHQMQRTNSLEKTLIMGKIKGKRRRGKQKRRWSESITNSVDIRSDQISRSVVSDSLRPHESQCLPVHHQLPEFTRTHSHPSSQWCHPAISSSVVPFSSCPQSLPASESFPMSQLLAWGGQSTGVSALASCLPKKSQGWSPSEWTGWISLQSKGLSRVFSNTTVQKHQFFSTQPSS